MAFTRRFAPVIVSAALMTGFCSLNGCQSSDNAPRNASSSGDSMSGTGGGNGTYGSNPAHAMHDNPAETQPAK